MNARRCYLAASLATRVFWIRRRGVTLMETLIAIFVVAVGLMGLVSLIPIGRWQMEEAARIDRGAALGRSAFRDLNARGHLRMENWSYCTTQAANQPVLDNQRDPNTGLSRFRPAPASTPNLATQMAPPYAPLVLDPLMVGYNVGNSTTIKAVSTFPYELPGSPSDDKEWSGAPRLARITLMNPLVASTSTPQVLGRSAAEVYFRGTDDRLFSQPEDRTLKPNSQFALLSSGSGPRASTTPAATQSRGDYTWFAVVNPDPYEVTALGARKVRQFSVAVVVCHKRYLQNLAGQTYTDRDRTRGERRAYLDFISSASFTQGSTDAVMTMSDLRTRDEADQATHLRNGEWIMVTAYVPIPGRQNEVYTDVQWFRVLSVGRSVYQLGGGRSDVWQRRIRLTGNSWTLPAANGGGTSTLAPGYAVIVDGAINVYRKTLINDGQSVMSQ